MPCTFRKVLAIELFVIKEIHSLCILMNLAIWSLDYAGSFDTPSAMLGLYFIVRGGCS